MKKDSTESNIETETKIVKTQNQKSSAHNIFENVKNKLIEVGVEYVKANMEQSKSAIFGFIEKNIEARIKKEIRRYQMITLGLIVLLIGVLFVLYSAFEFISYLANFPSFLTNLIFGFFLLIIGSIIYAINK